MAKIADVCKFCSAEADIDPELDPAPHVCPKCMWDRMCSLLLEVKLQNLDPASERAWTREHLMSDCGIKAEYADLMADGDFEGIERRVEQALLESVARYGVESPS